MLKIKKYLGKPYYCELGFTLAEALITLGIIGVLASLTMPVLITSHKKKVAVTRLQKFHSVIRQAVKMKEAETGISGYTGILGTSDSAAFDTSMLTKANDPDEMLKFFNENYAPYLKTTSVKKKNKGIVVALPDGSGMYLRKTSVNQSYKTTGYSYIVFCVDYKKCNSLDEAVVPPDAVDGKETFAFFPNGNVPFSYLSWDGTREGLVLKCNKNNKFYCVALIQYDGWEIKDDYPW